jgi:dihydroorotase
VDPATQTDERRDLAIADGVFVDPATVAGRPGTQVLDLAGKTVFPGFVDLHVHFREPGFEYKEDLASGTAAAAAGGFTTVVLMPNTNPAMDRVERVRDLEQRLAAKARVHCLISACLSLDRQGHALTDIAALRAQTPIVALSDDGNCVQDRALMTAAARLAAQAGLPILDHCEDEACMAGGVMRRGPVSERLQVPGMPGETESNIVARNVELARETGAHLHCQHLSYRASIHLLRQARAAGLPLTAEAAPHHLTLTVDEVPILGTNAKMNPPLGTRDDRAALHEALADGTITTIATDHAPHAPHEKARSVVQAPFGIIGLETAFPLCYTTLVRGGVLTLLQLVAKLTTGPAAVLRRPVGTLALGAPADATIMDLEQSYAVDITRTCSRSCNSPFHQRQVHGRILGTLVAGQWAYQAL